jgi:anti-sigma factor RsiW
MPHQLNCPARSELLDYSVGKLTDESSARVEAHIETCAACQATLGAIDDSRDALISHLRRPAIPDSYLEEPECAEAVARAKAMGSLSLGEEDRVAGL